jgi:amidophosphoribosyltransferase
MARTLGCDSLRYLPVESISMAVGLDSMHLCEACITGNYPTQAGSELYQIALDNAAGEVQSRTYETTRAAVTAG